MQNTIAKYTCYINKPLMKKIDKKIYAEILPLYKEGLNNVQIAEKLNISASVVCTHLKASPDYKGKKRCMLENIDKIIEMKKKRYSYREISEELGISMRSIQRYVHDADFKLLSEYDARRSTDSKRLINVDP